MTGMAKIIDISCIPNVRTLEGIGDSVEIFVDK